MAVFRLLFFDEVWLLVGACFPNNAPLFVLAFPLRDAVVLSRLHVCLATKEEKKKNVASC